MIVKDEPDPCASPIHGRRVLIVEDEPLIAMMLAQILSDLGVEVLGPFGSLADAYSALPQDFDAAVLDVNVGGEFIYPLAEQLSQLGAPMVFLTGYESQSLDPRFAEAPILTKPVEPTELIAALTGVLTLSAPQSALAG